MMAFITHFCTRLESAARGLPRLAARLLVGAALFCALPAQAESMEYRDARLAPREEGWALEADFEIELPARLEDAVNKGLALYFTLDFELTRPRWYWLDDKAVQISQSYRLDYHALTRQYRLSAGLGSLYLSFPTLPDALRVLAQPKIYAAERGKLKPGETYTGNVRLRLDVNRLPKPFQVETLTNREWVLDSDWKKFSVKMPEATAQTQPAPGGAGAAK